jgi:hypothetical protein
MMTLSYFSKLRSVSMGLLRAACLFGLIVEASSGCTTAASSGVYQGEYQAELDRDSIRQVVRQHFRAVSKCYEGAIDERPGAMGKVMAEWDIAPDGAVSNAHLNEVDPSLEALRPCLVSEISKWKFPASTAKDVTTVKYPFIFDERRPLKAPKVN